MQPESRADRCTAEDRTRQTAAKLPPDRTSRTATPVTRLARDLPGPAAFGSGPSRSKEGDADLSGVERVEGGGYGKPNRDGPGSTKAYRYGNFGMWCYSWPCPVLPLGYRTASRLAFF